MAKKGLYANIHAKRKRIKAGSGERMRTKGAKGAPTAKNFKDAAKTIKLPKTPATKGAGKRTKTIKTKPKLRVKRKAYSRRK